MKRLAITTVVLLLAGAGLWWGLQRGDAAVPSLDVSGTVEATDADLGFQIPGRVAEIRVREGDRVARGDELAVLDRAELEADALAAEARVAAAEARLRELRTGSRAEEIRSAEAALESAREREAEARKEAERARRLHEGGAVSEQALDRATTALAVARAQRVQAEQALELARTGPRTETIEAQEAVVAQARAALSRIGATLTNATIVAPMAGVVTTRHREPGESVPAGAPVLTVQDLDDRWVRIYVPEDRIGRVSLGQAAEIRSDTWPDRRYEGEVVFIGSEAEFTPRNVQTPEERTRLVYPVKVRITGDPEVELKPGVPADVVLREDG